MAGPGFLRGAIGCSNKGGEGGGGNERVCKAGKGLTAGLAGSSQLFAHVQLWLWLWLAVGLMAVPRAGNLVSMSWARRQ
jgi:hypothetical protein